jgi:hypothetical protein
MKFKYDYDIQGEKVEIQITWRFENNDYFSKMDDEIRKHEIKRDTFFDKLEAKFGGNINVREKMNENIRFYGNESGKFREDWTVEILGTVDMKDLEKTLKDIFK